MSSNTGSSLYPPPLTGLKVLELAGLAPGPFCGMLLSSHGASVLRIDRAPLSSSSSSAAAGDPATPHDPLTSYKSSIRLDLKSPPSLGLFKSLISQADVLIDPYRPGVLEKLGLDPDTVLLKLNPSLIVVRLTGFRKDGKYRNMAGHDINYLAVSGVLSLLGGAAGKEGSVPTPPANILADFAGGGLVAFVGVLLALLHRGWKKGGDDAGSSENRNTGRRDGLGQVVDANMVDGVSYLSTFPRLLLATPMWDSPRGSNLLDGGAPYYGVYECKEPGTYVSIAALEPQFFAALLRGLNLRVEDVVPHPAMERDDKKGWSYMKDVLARKFKSKTRQEWEAVFDGTDACVAPVLTMAELKEQGYDQRPLVGLSESPAKLVDLQWKGKSLNADAGGEATLRQWMGWRRGIEFDRDQAGNAVLISQGPNKRSKL